MMRQHTKNQIAYALKALQEDGYMVLMITFDKKSDESKPLGEAMEIIFSESQDPTVVSGMAREALAILGAAKAMNPMVIN